MPKIPASAVRPDNTALTPDVPVDDEFLGVLNLNYIWDGSQWIKDSGASSGTPVAVKVKDTADVAIDPATLQKQDEILAKLDEILTELQLQTPTLEARMYARSAQEGYSLWPDTGNSDYLYVLEAPTANGAGDTGFQGIRIPLNSDGAPEGKTELNTGGTLTWNNRTTDGNWS